MIYLDSSVALAHVFGEQRSVPTSFWDEPLTSSRLLEYEVWNRLHARGIATTHGEAARQLLERVTFIALTADVLARALEPFPVPMRTLDGLHLATINYLRGRGEQVGLASFDKRLLAGAQALGIALYAG